MLYGHQAGKPIKESKSRYARATAVKSEDIKKRKIPIKPLRIGGCGGVAPQHRAECLRRMKKDKKRKPIDNRIRGPGGIGPKWSWGATKRPDQIKRPSPDRVRRGFDDIKISTQNILNPRKRRQLRLPNGELAYDSYGNPIYEGYL